MVKVFPVPVAMASIKSRQCFSRAASTDSMAFTL